MTGRALGSWCALGAAMLVAVSLASAQEAWHTMTGPDKAFTVELPAAPKYTPTQVATPAGVGYTMHQYQLEQGAASYVVQYLTYPRDINIQNAQKNFEFGLNASGKRMDGGKWASIEFVKHQGFPAADAVGTREGSEIRSFSVLKGRQLFTLVYIGAPGTAKSADAERFVASLKVAP